MLNRKAKNWKINLYDFVSSDSDIAHSGTFIKNHEFCLKPSIIETRISRRRVPFHIINEVKNVFEV